MRQDEAFEHRLAAALKTRPVIDQAKGVLVCMRCETPDAAFAELKHVSENNKLKVNTLAAALVDIAAGRHVQDAMLTRIIEKEWGDLLPRC